MKMKSALILQVISLCLSFMTLITLIGLLSSVRKKQKE